MARPESRVRTRIAGLAWLAVMLAALAAAALARPAYSLIAVDSETQRLVARYGLPGASVRLSRSVGVVHRKAYGGYTGTERLPIASATKWLAALTVARLVERGELRWNSTVGEFFPDAPPSTHPITLAQLFSHTSGMAVVEAPCLYDTQGTLQACARELLAAPLVLAPGTAFAYGNNSMQVAGAMAERATGRSWDDIFMAEVAQPLGLSATDWNTGGGPGPGYVRNPNPRVGGGARSTMDDYGRVLDMLLAGGLHGGVSFLRADTLAQMALDRTAGLATAYTPLPGYGYGYGIGQWVEARDSFGATFRVSSPGAFGFTPWVDWRNGSSGLIVVSGNGNLMRAELTALQALCLRQLDFVRYLHTPPPAPPPALLNCCGVGEKPRPRPIATSHAVNKP